MAQSPSTSNTTRWLYAASMLGLQIPAQVVNVSLLFFYTDVKRLPPQWIAIALTVYALYFGLNGLVVTLSAAIVSVAFGLIAPAYGYDTTLTEQPATVATSFRIFMTGLPFGGCALAFLALLNYPLHGERLKEVKKVLAERHR